MDGGPTRFWPTSSTPVALERARVDTARGAARRADRGLYAGRMRSLSWYHSGERVMDPSAHPTHG
jgi:hypothetical protein